MLVVVVSGIYILTHVGKTVKEYKKQSAALSKVEAQLEEEQAKRDKQIEEKAQMELDDGAIVEIREEVFAKAAQLEKDIKAGKNKSKICYLTFDDGPYYRGKTILKILDKYDVKATFFLTTAKEYGIPCCLWDNGVWEVAKGSTDYSEHYGYYNRRTQTWYFPEIINQIVESTK